MFIHSKRIFALLFTAVFTLLLLSSCGKTPEKNTTEVSSISSEDTVTSAESTVEADTTEELPTEEETEESTQAEPETTEEETEEAETEAETGRDVSKMTKEEIVEYYNKVMNSAKSDSSSIHSNYMRHSVVGEMLNIPKALDSIGQKLIRDNMGEDKSKTNQTWTSQSDKNKYFPVENESYGSNLTAADVKSATITEQNGKYVITIVTVDDPRSEGYTHAIGHAPKAFNAVLPTIIDSYIPSLAKTLFSVGTVAVAYPSSTATVTVDPQTDHVQTANFKLNWTLYIPLSGTDVTLPFMTENDYVINW